MGLELHLPLTGIQNGVKNPLGRLAGRLGKGHRLNHMPDGEGIILHMARHDLPILNDHVILSLIHIWRRMRSYSSVGLESITLLSVYPQNGHFNVSHS